MTRAGHRSHRSLGGTVMALLVVLAACTSDGETSPSAGTTASTTATSATDATTAATTATTAATTTVPTSTTTVPAPPGYRLVWHDEFDGSGLPDPASWNVEHSTFGDGNRELQCYEPDQVEINDGTLVLTGAPAVAVCPNGSRREFTSGMVTSEGRQSFTTGWFEVRARVPAGQGLWPAVWLSPEDDTYGPWPRSGELDIMEIRGSDPGVARLNLHYTGTGGGREQQPGEVATAPGNSFADGFHTFALVWEPDSLTWLVDGIAVHEVTSWPSDAGPAPAPFDRPFFFRINLSIGGTFVGSPDSSTPWPAPMEVDYVRVFQRSP